MQMYVSVRTSLLHPGESKIEQAKNLNGFLLFELLKILAVGKRE